MKKEARDKALKMFLKAKGKITNKDIADAVKVNPLTVGRWKKEHKWEQELKKQAKAGAKPHDAVRGRIFKQAVSTKGKGRGIGTYSMKLLTEYLQGHISFRSTPDAGTTFEACFPTTPESSSTP